jgi:hypothetical protein
MDRVKSYIIVIILGVIFAYSSIAIMGYGAAIAIPSNVLESMANVAPSFAFVVLDLITLGLPLTIAYLVFVQVFKLIKANNINHACILLAVPFFLLHFYLFIITYPDSGVVLYWATTLPKYVLLGLCVWYLSKQWQHKA